MAAIYYYNLLKYGPIHHAGSTGTIVLKHDTFSPLGGAKKTRPSEQRVAPVPDPPKVPGIFEKVRLTVSNIPMLLVDALPEQIKLPVGSMAPDVNVAPHSVFEATKVVGFTDTMLVSDAFGIAITFPLGAKKAVLKPVVTVKIFVKFPPRVVPDATVARQDVLYMAELDPANDEKNTFPLGRRTAPQNWAAPDGVNGKGPIFV